MAIHYNVTNQKSYKNNLLYFTLPHFNHDITGTLMINNAVIISISGVTCINVFLCQPFCKIDYVQSSRVSE